MHLQKNYLMLTLLLLGVFVFAASSAYGQAKLPNILVIFGDDIGWFNVSAYNHGMMGTKGEKNEKTLYLLVDSWMGFGAG